MKTSLNLLFVPSKKSRLAACTLAVALLAALPAAHAHRTWLLPSSTVLSGEQPWVTVDAAVSNDLFYFEHNALRLDDLIIQTPDGKSIQPENALTGRYRSTFDVQLKQPGTYRLAVVGDTLMASYTLKGEKKRWRGKKADFQQALPKEAQDVAVSQMQSRTETYVTAGKPDVQVFVPSKQGIELVPVTHPNDLFAGEAASFQLLHDGAPAADLEVSIVQGGSRYQDQPTEIKAKTDDKGQFSVTWPVAGLYWINAGAGDEASPEAGTLDKPTQRARYSLTVEVLPL